MKKLKNNELERRFDKGEDMGDYMDVKTAHVVKPLKPKRINIDFPLWLVNSVDEEARKVGVTRQSILKMWIAERVQQEHTTHKLQTV